MYTAEITTQSPLLYDALNAAPAMRVEHVDDRIVRDGPIKLIVWASGGDFDAFERGLDIDPTVIDVRELATEEGRRLYRISYTPQGECESLTSLVTDLDATFLNAVATIEEFWMKIRFPDPKSVRTFADWHQQHQRSFSLRSLYEETEYTGGPVFDLTDSQREALALAHERGYFELPRESNTKEIAAELNISSQAFSERIRRGSRTIFDQLNLSSQR